MDEGGVEVDFGTIQILKSCSQLGVIIYLYKR